MTRHNLCPNFVYILLPLFALKGIMFVHTHLTQITMIPFAVIVKPRTRNDTSQLGLRKRKLKERNFALKASLYTERKSHHTNPPNSTYSGSHACLQSFTIIWCRCSALNVYNTIQTCAIICEYLRIYRWQSANSRLILKQVKHILWGRSVSVQLSCRQVVKQHIYDDELFLNGSLTFVVQQCQSYCIHFRITHTITHEMSSAMFGSVDVVANDRNIYNYLRL